MWGRGSGFSPAVCMGAGLLPSRALFWGGSLCSGQGKSPVHSLRTILALLCIRKHSYKFRTIPDNLGSIQTQNSKQATEFKGFWGSSKTYYSPLLPVQPEASERIVLETIPLKAEKSVFSRCSWRGCGAEDAVPGAQGLECHLPPAAPPLRSGRGQRSRRARTGGKAVFEPSAEFTN